MKKKLSLGRVVLFSAGSISTNIMAITVSTWLMFTYAPPPDSGRPTLVPLGLIGVILAIGSIFNAVIDPFLGHWSDTRRGKWGRRRPFILFFLPLSALLMMAIWTPPVKSLAVVNSIYLTCVMLFYYLAHSAWQIPYDGALPEMAQEPKDRVTLSTWKSVFALVGVLVGAFASGMLYNSALGPFGMGVVVGIAAMVGGALTLLGLREKKATEVGEVLPVWKGILATFRNKQFVYLFLATVFAQAAYGMLVVNLPYFVTTVLGKPSDFVSIIMGIVIVVMAGMTFVWSYFGKKHALRKLWRIATISIAIFYASAFLIGAIQGTASIVMTFIFFALIGVALSGSNMFPYAMMGSVADYDELKTRSRREAAYYGAFSLAVEGGPAIATLILPVLYKTFGYTQANPLGVRLAFLLIGLLAGLAVLFFRKYRLGDTPEEVKQFVQSEEKA